MAKEASVQEFFDSKVLGHPAGLFVLFFTEMWERFSFYGMRVLLINFLTIAAVGSNPGWEWSATNAGALFGTYAGLLYLTPIIGGVIADKYTGYRNAVLIGCVVMTMGHASMAFETELSMYIGLGLLVAGTGFFKPNIVSIISEMYKYLPEKKDGAYTIFYMGVNSGAFFGMMMCGYLAERVGWAWGFGLAGFFMLFGTLQFMWSKRFFAGIGDKKSEDAEVELDEDQLEPDYKPNHFTMVDKILIAITSVIGFLYLIDDPLSKISATKGSEINILPKELFVSAETMPGPLIILLIGFVLFVYLIVTRLSRYSKIVRDRMIAVIIFAFFTVLFFIPFEQAATSMVIFARDYTDRVMTGNAALMFNIFNTLLTIIPLIIVTWVLYLLNKQTFKKIPKSNVVLAVCFAFMWGIAVWMLYQDWNTKAYEIEYQAVAVEQVVDGETKTIYQPINENRPAQAGEEVLTLTNQVPYNKVLNVGEEIFAHFEADKFVYIDAEMQAKLTQDYITNGQDSQVIMATVTEVKDNEVEITVSWFSILNSFFIIAFASLFTKWWDSKYNPSAAMKYGLGLIVMAIGFAVLAIGAGTISEEAARVGIVWLILAYLFHTLGELFLSPVGSSYVSKLVPARMIALMFGMWYLANAIGNKISASLGGLVDRAQDNPDFSLSNFFWIFALVPAVAGVVVILLNPLLKKLMHGVR